MLQKRIKREARKRVRGTGKTTEIAGHYLKGCTSEVKKGERPNEPSY